MTFRKGIRLFIKLSHQAECSVSVVILKARGQHILGAGEQNPLSIQLKEVRTFPHFSDAVAVGCQNLFKGPLESIGTGIQKNLSASIRRTVADHAAVGAILFSPHLGIAEILPACSFRKILFIQYRIHLILFIVDSVTYCKTLGLDVGKSPVCFPLSQYTRVHQQLSAIGKFNGTSGKAAVSVIDFIRSKCSRKVLPVQKVFADCMSPVHGAPDGFIGMILIKHMVFSLIVGKTIGIIHPAYT